VSHRIEVIEKATGICLFRFGLNGKALQLRRSEVPDELRTLIQDHPYLKKYRATDVQLQVIDVDKDEVVADVTTTKP